MTSGNDSFDKQFRALAETGISAAEVRGEVVAVDPPFSPWRDYFSERPVGPDHQEQELRRVTANRLEQFTTAAAMDARSSKGFTWTRCEKCGASVNKVDGVLLHPTPRADGVVEVHGTRPKLRIVRVAPYSGSTRYPVYARHLQVCSESPLNRALRAKRAQGPACVGCGRPTKGAGALMTRPVCGSCGGVMYGRDLS